MTYRRTFLATALLLLTASIARAEVTVLIDHNADADPQFKFQHAPQPVRHDAADQAYAEFSIVDGESDPNGSSLSALNDGRLPEQEDDPAHNFFFAAGGDGGRL